MKDWLFAVASAVTATAAILAVAYSAAPSWDLLATNYGWSVFVFGPLASGAIAVLTFGSLRPVGVRRAIFIPCLTQFVAGAVVIALAIEGVICVLMALPLALITATLGGLLANSLLDWRKQPKGNTAACLLLLVPLWLGFRYEPEIRPQPAPREVSTEIEIHAPASAIWPNIVEFPPIPHKPGLLFQMGVSYPTHASISGTGVGAIRRCEFSTGTFVEPITVWREPWELSFDVTQNPPTMRELTPYKNITPPHTTAAFRSSGGRFLLETQPGGTTTVRGTTWYSQSLWPQAYWNLLADQVIHRIHGRVLQHVKALSEG